MSLLMFLRRLSSTEVFLKWLCDLDIKANKYCIKIERVIVVDEGLIIIETYTWLESSLGLHMKYLKFWQGFAMLPSIKFSPYTNIISSKLLKIKIFISSLWGDFGFIYAVISRWYISMWGRSIWVAWDS